MNQMPDHLTDDHALLRHEALDRAHVLGEGVAAALMDHPFISQRPALAALAEQAQAILADLYQAIGAATPGDAELTAENA